MRGGSFYEETGELIRQASTELLVGASALEASVEARLALVGALARLWFGVVLLGLVMSITGLILDFVTFGQTRYVLQVSNYLHIAGATLYMAAAMGHIYIGTIGAPGSYDSMRQGHVDENWAKEHHSLWLAQEKKRSAATPPNAVPAE